MRQLRGWIGIACFLSTLAACGMKLQLGQADRLMAAGRYQEAVTAYLTIIQRNPAAAEARQAALRIGEIYEGPLKRPEDAVRVYRGLIKRHSGTPEAQEALWRLGTHYYQQKDYARALSYFVQIVMDFPESERAERAQLQRAACYVGMGRYPEALEIYRNFLRYYADSVWVPESWLRRAQIYEEHLDRRDKAIALYRGLVERFPQSSQAAEARRRLRDLGAENPSPPAEKEEGGLRQVGPPTRPNARAILESWTASPVFGFNARDLLLGDDGPFGGEELQESLASDGALLDDAVYNLGLMFAMRGEYRKAGACLERALELGVEEPNLYLQLGICYREVGAIERARAMFRKLYARDPHQLDRLIQVAGRHQAEGRREVARRHYEALLGIDPRKDPLIRRHLTELRDTP